MGNEGQPQCSIRRSAARCGNVVVGSSVGAMAR